METSARDPGDSAHSDKWNKYFSKGLFLNKKEQEKMSLFSRSSEGNTIVRGHKSFCFAEGQREGDKDKGRRNSVQAPPLPHPQPPPFFLHILKELPKSFFRSATWSTYFINSCNSTSPDVTSTIKNLLYCQKKANKKNANWSKMALGWIELSNHKLGVLVVVNRALWATRVTLQGLPASLKDGGIDTME